MGGGFRVLVMCAVATQLRLLCKQPKAHAAFAVSFTCLLDVLFLYSGFTCEWYEHRIPLPASVVPVQVLHSEKEVGKAGIASGYLAAYRARIEPA